MPSEPEVRSNRLPADVVAAIRRLVSDGVVVEGGDLDIADQDLSVAEEQSLGNIVPARRREFRAGRIYARQALQALGIPACIIPVGPDRVPVWPTAIAGSISHTNSLCAVAVGLSADWTGIGIDIEDDSSLSDELTKLVSRASELEQRQAIEKQLGYDLPKLLFVIKEAFYKMHFPLHRQFLTFQDVCVELDVDNRTAQARIVPSDRLAVVGNICFEGRFDSVHGTLFSCFEVAAH
ncbi:4'-phosphopantetheinyl transferase family protein [Mesorhizobium neociceri]|uniref:Enterobactin synthase component D n=1 Tax=Mesorhizobium neociceri TaxID=1307853 RepID=A0A838BAX9_9HYPH|nr:4'-phosphopantetheinyl transferase superfamily protein [Mesorhizobium neociceri]MBA1143382.1 4'-phosphopantetheinyl transferase superfamily protein [Mesorhizobium neociceri]